MELDLMTGWAFGKVANLIWFAFGLAVMKGVVEPAAAHWGSRGLDLLSELLIDLDPYLPQAIRELDPVGVSRFIRHRMLGVAETKGAQLSEKDQVRLLAKYLAVYDPVVNAAVTPKEIDLDPWRG